MPNRIVAAFNNEWLKDHSQPLPPAQLVVRSWFNPNLESQWFIVPGIVALLTLVVTTVVTALSVAREREVGTFEQLLVTPFRPFEIMIGKSVPAMIIGFIEGTIIIAVGVFWFGVPLRGNLALLYAGLFLYILAVIGVGLMISSISRTQQQAILGDLSVRRAGGNPVRLRHADRQYAAIDPVSYARQPDALLPDHRARDLPRRPAGPLGLRPVMADGGHRRRDAVERKLAVSPPSGVMRRSGVICAQTPR